MKDLKNASMSVHISTKMSILKTTKEKKGGIITKENFIHISNLKDISENKNKEKTAGKK